MKNMLPLNGCGVDFDVHRAVMRKRAVTFVHLFLRALHAQIMAIIICSIIADTQMRERPRPSFHLLSVSCFYISFVGP